MKVLKHIGIGLLFFALTFSAVFSLSDKTEHEKTEYCAQEPRVYVTDHGERYHSFGCHYLSRSRNAKGLYKARSQGYRACSYCKGTPYGTIEVNYYKTEIKDITNEVAIKSIIVASVSVTIYAAVCVIYYCYGKSDKRKIGRRDCL